MRFPVDPPTAPQIELNMFAYQLNHVSLGIYFLLKLCEVLEINIWEGKNNVGGKK